jgi:holo-[acyl-carrier protein] synthase
MIGIDIIKTSRMQALIERFGDKALLKFLCKEERLLVRNYKSAAGYWAAKEACSKALGTGIGARCSFFDIKIYKESSGAPKIALSKKVVEMFHIQEVNLSITHDGEYAVAVVAIRQSTATNEVKQF